MLAYLFVWGSCRWGLGTPADERASCPPATVRITRSGALDIGRRGPERLPESSEKLRIVTQAKRCTRLNPACARGGSARVPSGHGLMKPRVDIRGEGVEQAQRSIDPIGLRIENEDLMARRLRKLERTSQAQFERHVETHRSSGPTEIMDPHQPSITLLWNLEHTVGLLAKEDKRSHECNEERLIPVVKRRVDEYSLGVRSRHSVSPERGARLRRESLYGCGRALERPFRRGHRRFCAALLGRTHLDRGQNLGGAGLAQRHLYTSFCGSVGCLGGHLDIAAFEQTETPPLRAASPGFAGSAGDQKSSMRMSGSFTVGMLAVDTPFHDGPISSHTVFSPVTTLRHTRSRSPS